ncbi:MAG: universal stress protein [Candidatus Diapherotrites archaeon]|nr:universal stress protein [Candidatus Diapherotrites archaeon]
MHVLIPILTKLEANEEFLEKATKGMRKVTVLIVVDASLQETFGIAASSLAQAQQIAEQIKAKLGKKRKSCEVLLEWGSTAETIDRIARLRAVSKIALMKDENSFFRQIVKKLSKSSAYGLEIVALSA